jgi:hypothetical protein
MSTDLREKVFLQASRTWLADVELSADHADRGHPICRKSIGEQRGRPFQ